MRMDKRCPACRSSRRAGWGPGAVPITERRSLKVGVVIVTEEVVRRRSRQAVPRPRTVQFSLTQVEFEHVSQAAAAAGMARGAFAAEVTLATAGWVFWYNNERLHSWCGDVPPMEFEEAFWQRGLLAQPPAVV